MHEHRAKHLLGDVKEPNLDGPLGPLAPALEHEREQRQPAERELHKVAHELAVAPELGVRRRRRMRWWWCWWCWCVDHVGDGG